MIFSIDSEKKKKMTTFKTHSCLKKNQLSAKQAQKNVSQVTWATYDKITAKIRFSGGKLKTYL